MSDMQGFVKEAEVRQRMVKAAAARQSKNTFLSHSSKDNVLLPGAIRILENHGASVYVDVGDDRLPDPPSVQTAQVLRDTVQAMRKFVLLVSPNSRRSNWIPWELGLADGHKSAPNVTLFPAVATALETRWVDQEYLGLYTRIVWGPHKAYEKNIWMVYDHHDNTGTELSEWLRR